MDVDVEVEIGVDEVVGVLLILLSQMVKTNMMDVVVHVNVV